MKELFIALLILGVLVVAFCMVTLILIHRAHKEQFSRADYKKTSDPNAMTYDDFASAYPREIVQIQSGENMLKGFLYRSKTENGLVIISSGHRCSTECYLTDMQYFVDHGWTVFCYDYAGYYNSEGKEMIDYIQAVKDLDSVLAYFEEDKYWSNIPHFLYGHSLGAYASTAVLNFKHTITAVVAASGFDKPVEQWSYSVKRFSGALGNILGRLAGIYLRVLFGKDTVDFSAIKGINANSIPVLVISGTQDEYYGGESPIYAKKDQVTNPKCSFILMQQEGHNGHSNYTLSDRAVEYQKRCKEEEPSQIDKWLCMEYNPLYYDRVHQFFLDALSH